MTIVPMVSSKPLGRSSRGMTLKFMPLLDLPEGFALIIGTMVMIALVLGAVFWRRKWLG